MYSLKVDGSQGVEAAGGRYRLLKAAGGAAVEIRVEASPFMIGRSGDCQLVLPEDEQLRAVTSRWHCYLREKDGELTAVDGSLNPMPETGRPKPSVTGTLVNGRRIAGPTVLSPGDMLTVGPWSFEVVGGKTPETPAGGGDVFEDIARGQGRKVEAADPKLKEKFGQMHELVQRLAQIPDAEEAIVALLSYATTKIPSAEVAAILLARADGNFAVRLAWQKGLGKVPDFTFSNALLKRLPAEQSFLLQAKLQDRSVSQSIHDISSGLLLPLWGKGARLGVLYMDNRRNGVTFSDEDLYLGSAIASLVSLQLSLERQGELAAIEDNMARYFAPDVVQRIVEESAAGKPTALEVQERDVSVLFVDMEGFTTLSRTKTPREISEILNPYLGTVANCIQEEGGHVNKFIGDAVMGIFGANPGQTGAADPSAYAAQAVRSALLMPRRWVEEAARLKLPANRIRIGINSGRAVVGNIGYSTRLEYSVLGDAVNIASRMEKQAPANGAAITEATHALIREQFDFEDLGERQVKGVGAMRVYRPLRASSSQPADESSRGNLPGNAVS